MKPIAIAAFIAYQIAGAIAAWDMIPTLFAPMVRQVEANPTVFCLGMAGLAVILLAAWGVYRVARWLWLKSAAIKRLWCFLFHWTKLEMLGKHSWRCGNCGEIWDGG